MGSLSETSKMIVTKGFFLIFGLMMIGHSHGHEIKRGKNYVPTYFPSMETMFKGFGNVNQPSWNFKSPGLTKNMDENLMKSSSSAFLARRFLNKPSAIDKNPAFEIFLSLRG